MKIHYRIKNNAIEIVRCYGTDEDVYKRQTKDWQNISRMAHGSQLQTSVSSLMESDGEVLSL